MTTATTSAPQPFRLDLPVPRRLGPAVNAAAERMLGLGRLRALYASIPATSSADGFLESALATMRVCTDVAPDDVARIPRTGAVVAVANHPFGAVEGLVLLRLLRSVRSDVLILANRLLRAIPELDELILDVDVMGTDATSAASNRRSILTAIRHLRAGGMLAVFPAGEVAHVRFGEGVVDSAWCSDIAAFVRLGRADALPIRFEGSNGPLFQAAGMIHPRLRTALLPRELLNKTGRVLRLHVGAPIRHARLVQLGDDPSITAYLRMRTDLLARRSVPPAGSRRESDGVEIAPAEDSSTMAAEIAALPTDRCLAVNGTLAVYLCAAREVPVVLQEIGRLREETFREVGEGTGRTRDLDRFDPHYLHLVLWDRETRAVAGSYRLARTDLVIAAHGRSGLYTTTLFRLGDDFFNRLGPAIELGRSFIAPAWQRSFSPLMLLWKGIAAFVLQTPGCRTVFGPVSISRRYAAFSRQLMIEWLRLHASAPEFEDLARPRRPVRARRGHVRHARTASAVLADIDELSAAVADLEPSLRGVPVLLREYHRLAGRFAAFNVDPDFSDVVDGLVVIDLVKTERRTLARYMGKDGAARFAARHA
ncbi:MAG: lysophospholipid acyltransferase family protein [Planctomycetes bacterium]|nr:lysophospholipid acyltransferase family protein [Planctomycetota bacterium]